jgi:hypothetical protein
MNSVLTTPNPLCHRQVKAWLTGGVVTPVVNALEISSDSDYDVNTSSR